MRGRHAAIVGLLTVAGWAAVAGQAPPGGTKAVFEVASIKRSATLDAGGSMGFQPSGRFRVVNVEVRQTIASAYGQGLPGVQVVGGPDWVASDRYEITAKVAADLLSLGPAELYPKMPELLQSLLEERFKLRTHRETRPLQRYALMLARKDGPQLRRSSVDCKAPSDRCSIKFLPGQLLAGHIRVASLIGFLGGQVGRVVVDRTGLDGWFDVDLEWSPDQSSSDKPSLFTALQEQLGLKLEAERGPVDIIVVDHVERPTED